VRQRGPYVVSLFRFLRNLVISLVRVSR